MNSVYAARVIVPNSVPEVEQKPCNGGVVVVLWKNPVVTSVIIVYVNRCRTMDCAAIAERSITKVTVRVVAVILWSRILVNFVSIVAVFWSPIGRTAVLRAVHFLLTDVISRTNFFTVVILAVNIAFVVVVITRAVYNVAVVVARAVYVAASRTVVGYVAVIVITVVTVIIVWAVNVNAALGSYVTHVVTVITAFIDIPVLR